MNYRINKGREGGGEGGRREGGKEGRREGGERRNEGGNRQRKDKRLQPLGRGWKATLWDK